MPGGKTSILRTGIPRCLLIAAMSFLEVTKTLVANEQANFSSKNVYVSLRNNRSLANLDA